MGLRKVRHFEGSGVVSLCRKHYAEQYRKGGCGLCEALDTAEVLALALTAALLHLEDPSRYFGNDEDQRFPQQAESVLLQWRATSKKLKGPTP